MTEPAPRDRAAVLRQLKRGFGEPAALRSGAGGSSSLSAEGMVATWDLPHNGKLTFNGLDKSVEMLGPVGALRRLPLINGEDYHAAGRDFGNGA
ncbi:MAG TPA: hypothetical protein VMV59_07415 [Candidatus Dormibacteraeota bacterium]|nr:hypothetical protein [Candidatus Dormibacteraeota bacterium]